MTCQVGERLRMRRQYFAAATAGAIAVLVCAVPALAQGAASGPQGLTYAEIKQMPDWSGNWQVDPGPGGKNPNDFLPELDLSPLFKHKRDDMIALAKRLGDDFNTNTKV